MFDMAATLERLANIAGDRAYICPPAAIDLQARGAAKSRLTAIRSIRTRRGANSSFRPARARSYARRP